MHYRSPLPGKRPFPPAEQGGRRAPEGGPRALPVQQQSAGLLLEWTSTGTGISSSTGTGAAARRVMGSELNHRKR